MKILPRKFYSNDTLQVARELLGKYIVHKIGGEELTGMIVETEAYIGPHDKAAHSYNNRRTDRNEVMYGPPGYAYVYAIYGMYYCMNVVTADVDKPEAVLIRAIEPVKGLDTMAQNRFQKRYEELHKSEAINIANGPGKLCKALGINKSNNGDDLCKDRLFIAESGKPMDFSIESSPRINIGYAEEAVFYPWRYYIKGNPYVSRVKFKIK